MPVFAPGAWAGVNDALAVAREREQEQQRLAESRQRMAMGDWTMRTQQQDRQRALDARAAAGRAMMGMAPPQPSPQPPMPGQSSQPMLAPGVPQFGGQMPPQGPPQGQGAQPPQQPQGPAPGGAPGAAPGMPQFGRYRALPQPGMPMQPQGGQMPGMPMPPPPMPTATQPRQGNLIGQIIASARANGVTPDQLPDVIEALNPVLKIQLQEEVQQLRADQLQSNEWLKILALGIKQNQGDRAGDQRDRALDQGDARIAISKNRLAAAVKRANDNNTAGEELSPEGLKVAVELTRAGMPIPGGWSKKGISRGNAILNQLAAEEEGGAGSGSVATGRADAKAAGAALTQNTKDLAAIRPYKAMLDKNASIAIDLGRKIMLSDSQLANKPIQWLQKNSGSNPDLREYLAQIQIVQTEAARVLNNPRLVGQLTDSARHEMQEIISGTMPLADTERVIRRMMQDGQNRVAALEEENRSLKAKSSGRGDSAPATNDPAPKNAKGWTLHVDAKGNKAYVSPDGKQFEEVR